MIFANQQEIIIIVSLLPSSKRRIWKEAQLGNRSEDSVLKILQRMICLIGNKGEM